MAEKIAFVFDDIALTLTPADIEAVLLKWELAHPGKLAHRDLTGPEFADACLAHMKANARPARTVLHN